MKAQDPFAILGDERVVSVLRRLHAEADRWMPGLILHDLPKLPEVLLYLAYVRASQSGFASMTLPFKSGTEYPVRLAEPAGA